MNQTQRENHSAKERRLQVIFPLDLGLKLPEDDSLRLLIEITEEMDFRELYAAYERREAAGEATAKQLFQLVVFGFMNGHYSLRSISAACGYDIRIMYLLQGKKMPSASQRSEFSLTQLLTQNAELLPVITVYKINPILLNSD